ncbi:MAG: hypothetical protein L6406_08905 [Desulfobacterales bacterium]|nr:hypothetical protein [Desulfobacterales bacterium]
MWGYDAEAIREAIQKALEPSFRTSMAGLTNQHCDGRSVERILTGLKEEPMDHRIFQKRFVENDSEVVAC